MQGVSDNGGGHDPKAIGQRIREARKAAGLTLKEVGRLSGGVTPQGVNQWESGRSSPFGDKLRMLCQSLGVSVDWLITGKGQRNAGEPPLALAASGGRRLMPLLAWHQVRADNAAKNSLEAGSVASQFPVGENAYALEINDDANEPEYNPGDRIIIDPDLEWTPGDMVIWMPKEGRAYMRRVRQRPGERQLTLQPLNRDYASQDVTEVDHGVVVGVVVEHARRPRKRREH